MVTVKISNIKESGASNILNWAISKNANIKEDTALMSLINDETFYLITLEDVNFFELFRLTQMYRDKLRIANEKVSEIPSEEELKELFPGEFKAEGKDPIKLTTLAENAISTFMDLTCQMKTDSDIIQPGAVRMFIPMIARKFDVQIPVSFVDLVDSMSNEESSKMFTAEYPNTLKDIIDSEVHGVKTRFCMGFVKATQIIKYNQRYNQCLDLIKYAPIKTYNQMEKLYRFGLVGFSKRDTISRGQVTCSLFKSDQELIANTLAKLNRLNTLLELDFAVQLPIQYMQLLANSFDEHVLPITNHCSMNTIIERGLVYEDFQSLEDGEGEEHQMMVENHLNQIRAYKVRIAEANSNLLKTIPIIIKSDENADITGVFSMLPSIYNTVAIIRVNMDNMSKYTNHEDPVLKSLFNEISDISYGVVADIKKSNK